MRDLGFPVADPALLSLNWVNLGSCFLSIFDFYFFFYYCMAKYFLESWAIIPPIAKSKPRSEKRVEGREGA